MKGKGIVGWDGRGLIIYMNANFSIAVIASILNSDVNNIVKHVQCSV